RHRLDPERHGPARAGLGREVRDHRGRLAGRRARRRLREAPAGRRRGRLRLGLLSTANINRLVIAGARATSDVQVVAVASRDRARAEEYPRRHDIPRAHGSYEALLADPDVDGIYISLPNSMHVDWSVHALEAGK